ncbi:MAG: hypothetical protein R3261_04330, partial [Alphaproteobacteria bacterium]|nr:hypothetical protein [Alphaproteobacteria bacterium]
LFNVSDDQRVVSVAKLRDDSSDDEELEAGAETETLSEENTSVESSQDVSSPASNDAEDQGNETE